MPIYRVPEPVTLRTTQLSDGKLEIRVVETDNRQRRDQILQTDDENLYDDDGSGKVNIIEQDIRLLREREAELANLKRSIYGNQSPTSKTSASRSPFSVDPDGEDVFHYETVVYPDPASQRERHDSAKMLREESKTDSVLHKDKIYPGERLILKELREQKKREDELKRHWLEMGYLINDQESSDDDEDDEKTKVNEKQVMELERIDKVKPHATKENKARTSKHYSHGVTSAPANYNGHEQLSIQIKDKPTSSLSLTLPSSYSSERQQQTSVFVRQSSKVQPFEDPELEERVKFHYAPEPETPIEREIRLALTRENDFKQIRGLVLSDKDSSEKVQMKSHTLPKSRTHYNPEHPAALDEEELLKKYSARCIQSEILREKRREVDLKNEGKIHTISEERAERPSYPVIAEAILKEKPAYPTEQTVVVKQNSYSSPGKPLTDRSTETEKTSRESKKTANWDGRMREVDLSIKVQSARTPAEKRIDEEVKELQRREEEIRLQRALLQETLQQNNEKRK